MDREGSKRQSTQGDVLSIPELMEDFYKLPKERQAVNHGLLADHIDASVAKAVTDYVRSGGSKEMKRDLVTTLRRVADMDVPHEVKRAVMEKATDHVLNFESDMPKIGRDAWATMTLHAGGHEISEDRARHLINAYIDAFNSRNKSPSADTRMHIAEQLLARMGIMVETTEEPSLGEVVAMKMRENSRKVAITAIAAGTAGSILVGGSNVAFAESPSSAAGTVGGGGIATTAVQMTPETTAQTALAASPKPGVSISVDLNAKTAAVQFSGTEMENASPIKGAVAIPNVVKAQPAVTMTGSTTEARPNVALHSAVSVNQVSTKKNSKAHAVTFATPTETVKDMTASPTLLAPHIAPTTPNRNSETANPSSSLKVESALDTTNTAIIPVPTAAEMNTTPATAPAETVTKNPDGTVTEMTKAQKILAGIKTSILTGDVATAANMMIAHYHNKSVTGNSFDAKGNPIIPITNQELLDSLANDPTSSVEAATLSAIHGNAHTDPTYTQNVVAAMSVLEAAAHDQTIFDAQDVKDLIANAKRPTGQYEGKLFDKYLQKASDILQAKDDKGKVVLLDGFTTANAETIKSLYAYVLMGQDSDSDQKSQETAMQQADEAIAAAATAAEKASAGGTYQQAIEQAAQANSWTHFKAQVMIALAANGVAMPQASAIVGNFSQEAGAGLAPNAQERPGSEFFGLGLAQMTGGRHTSYVNAARAAGFDPYNDTSDAFINWQVAFIVNQAKQSYPHTWAAMRSTNDVPTLTNIWSDGFEGPGVPMEWKRLTYAGDTFNQVNAQIDAINAAEKAAAEAAKAKAEAAAKAAAEARNPNTPEGAQQICADLGISYHGPEAAYRKGQESTAYLCEIPAQYLTESSGGHVYIGVAIARQVMTILQKTNLKIMAGFRTNAAQTYLHDGYVNKKPGFNRAAKPGYSDHQDGVAVDFAGPNGESINEAMWNQIYTVVQKENLELHNLNDNKAYVPPDGKNEPWHWSIDGL